MIHEQVLRDRLLNARAKRRKEDIFLVRVKGIRFAGGRWARMWILEKTTAVEQRLLADLAKYDEVDNRYTRWQVRVLTPKQGYVLGPSRHSSYYKFEERYCVKDSFQSPITRRVKQT